MKLLQALVGAALLLPSALQAADLSIKVDGIKGEQGQLLVALYDSDANFLNADKASKQLTVALKDAQSGFKLADLEPGTYAIAIIFDTNSNGKLDTNFIGIPKEAIGTSNNIKPRFGPPRFADAKFEIKESRELSITLFDF